MVTAKEAAEVQARPRPTATIDIVVGTHALLAKGVEFADLGLLIVDEEQHFGVAHKERLKALKADVHVLTLTATPIPRTLQLALTGVREMSLIATPPVDRLAVRTFVMPFDARGDPRGDPARALPRRPGVLRRAAHRGPAAHGASALREIVPEARIIAGARPAGADRAGTGDDRVRRRQATTSCCPPTSSRAGLDMPAVNTLVIHRADMFGLAQLYQLRGRVGRGKQRGYAYLTWPPNARLSAAAREAADGDADAGQRSAPASRWPATTWTSAAPATCWATSSPAISARSASSCTSRCWRTRWPRCAPSGGRKRTEERDWTPNISLGLPVLIPEDYVRDLPVRLGLYRRIGALASDAETEAMAAELVDRFGAAAATEVENLLEVVALKRAVPRGRAWRSWRPGRRAWC